MLQPISDAAHALMTTTGRRGSRARYQRGWVEETGLRVKKWKGHYYTYEKGADGGEHRIHRAQTLGLKSEFGKKEAERRLQELVDKECNNVTAKASPAVTLEWFVENRCFPLWRERWKASHVTRSEYLIRRYVVGPFAQTPLAEIDRFKLQVHANEIAKIRSKSIVSKFVNWTRAVFDEAVEQDFLIKSPARMLVFPRDLKAENRRALTLAEVERMIASLDGRDGLILRMYLVLGLRARELFALRRDDVAEDRIRIDETLDHENNFHKPKTASSSAWLWLPPSLGRELREWMERVEDRSPAAVLFTASNGAPIRAENWRKRVLQVAAEKLGLEGVTIHALRRTCATLMNQAAGIKDVQAHLRHARPDITAAVYVQEIPESVRTAVGKLADRLLNSNNGEGE